ncbi:ATP-binding cassette domain-containing protein [Aeromicrobium sp. 636]|uniref:ABC-F family ATP-binding cassette domain-containing protein n=1 Tax=Aeromicrobium senzhongii TaxID=2663859 RepID=A0A8I0EX64_9ACTN|nr:MULTISPECIES: ABC-F family ATP-binding cassette domain-containing protein [Aeromicrobium]MBC9226937.1 ABC-F family ATP-binding cassette domain-containing protein [Aeromicrobium senzhongii]MCQ3999037.1 ATP-binding cassette domain-containing protein [Aeromicrobium sp. 636]
MSCSLTLSHASFVLPEGRTLLEDLTFSLGPGRHGVVGDNGSGKSTLLRLLTGALPPTTGTVQVHGRLAHLQQTRAPGAATVADVLGVTPALAALGRIEAGSVDPADYELIGDDWDLPDRVERWLDRVGLAGLETTRPIEAVSGGEATLLRLAGLMLADPEVLLLDEPTNDLDRPARHRLEQIVDDFTGVLVVVSHDRGLLEHMQHIGEVRCRQVRWFGGPFSAWARSVELEQDAAHRAVSAARADVRRQRQDLVDQQTKQAHRDRQGRANAGSLPKIVAGAYQRRAEVSAGRLRGMHEDRLAASRSALESAQDRVRDDRRIRVDLPDTRVPARREVLRAVGVVPAHGTDRPFDLDLRGPERIALVGRNGAGKSSLLRALLGLQAPRAGRVEVHVPWRYLPQGVDLLDPGLSVLENVRRAVPGADPARVRAQLARFLFRGGSVDQVTGTLSGGERWRATLASLLLATPAPQLLVLDEPTNDLDLASIAHLAEALESYRGALLVVSHDESFLADLDLDRTLTVP